MLVNSYEVLTEIALWLSFIVVAFAGYMSAGLTGLAFGLAVVFIVSVFMVAPFMMVSDIRKSLVRMEAQGLAPGSYAQTSTTRSVSNNGAMASPQRVQPTMSARSPGHVKNYKGYEITKSDGQIFVAGQPFDGVLKAESWIDEQKSNQAQ